MPNINTTPIAPDDLNRRQLSLNNLSMTNTDTAKKHYLQIMDLVNDPIMDDVTAAEMRKIFIAVWDGYWANGVQGSSDDLMCNKLGIDPAKIQWSKVCGVSKSSMRPKFSIPTASGEYGEPWLSDITLRGNAGRFHVKLKLDRQLAGGWEYKLRSKDFRMGISITDIEIDESLLNVYLNDDSIVLKSSPTSVQSFTEMTTSLFNMLMRKVNADNGLKLAIANKANIGARYDIYR